MNKVNDYGVTMKFQSTRPRGARLGLDSSGAKKGIFQSTRPRGARRAGLPQEAQGHAISIHAPARGATLLGQVKLLISR